MERNLKLEKIKVLCFAFSCLKQDKKKQNRGQRGEGCRYFEKKKKVKEIKINGTFGNYSLLDKSGFFLN